MASPFLIGSFALLAITVAALFPLGIWVSVRQAGSARGPAAIRTGIAAGATTLWLAGTFLAAWSGALAFGPMPPPMALLFIVILAGAVGLGMSPVGERLARGIPLAVLVGVQGFRLPLELLMHRAYEEGVMPVQMSYSGWNFDILTGASAIVVAALLARGSASPRLAKGWNVVGSALLANVLAIAWLSTPTPLRLFMAEPANIWITRAPFVWLPSVLVFAGILGHVLIFRALAIGRTGVRTPHPVADRRRTPAAAGTGR
jgi:hypothetical protein